MKFGSPIFDYLEIQCQNGGKRVFTNLSSLIILHGDIIAGNARTTLREHTGSAGYTPSGSNKLYVSLVGVQCTSSTNTQQWQFLYADNDVGLASATAWTNPVRMAGASVAGASLSKTSEQGDWLFFATNFQIPNGKYMGCEASGAAGYTFQAFGYEGA